MGQNTQDAADAAGDHVEDLVAERPLVELFGTNAKTKILSVLLDAYPRPLNVSTICERADIHHDTWYRHVDDLLATGLVVETTDAGTTLFSVPGPDDDQRTEWLEQLRDWTAAYQRDGRRPARED